MGKLNNSPDFQDLKPLTNHVGAIRYRNQIYRYLFAQKGASLSLFVFDPQTDGMTLTNACDFVIEAICNEMIKSNILNRTQLQDLLSAGLVALRDSNGDWSTVKVKITDALNIHGDYILTGAVVGGWRHLDITPEYLELFKLMG
jgi:hypothetical protein